MADFAGCGAVARGLLCEVGEQQIPLLRYGTEMQKTAAGSSVYIPTHPGEAAMDGAPER